MSQGCLLLATEHDSIDYIGMSNLAASLVMKHLNIPTHIHINPKPEKGNVRAFRWDDGSVETVQWHNSDRPLAFDISPFEETLLIDVDYLTFNNSLAGVFGSANEFLCYDTAWDVTQTGTLNNETYMTRNGLNMLWATVVYFRKTELAHNIFETMKMIQNSWGYYSKLYGFIGGKYRNDFALTIAHQLMNGYTNNTCTFDHALCSLGTEDTIYDVQDNQLLIRYRHGTEHNALRIQNTNLHCMNKRCLQDEQILEGLWKLAA